MRMALLAAFVGAIAMGAHAGAVSAEDWDEANAIANGRCCRMIEPRVEKTSSTSVRRETVT